MAEHRLLARSAFPDWGKPARFGKPGEPGVAIRLIENLQIACVLARRGARASLSARAQELFGAATPDGPHRTAAERICMLGIGPGRYLFLREESGDDFAPMLMREFAGIASISDHSDGYSIFEIAGGNARSALAKGVAIDLHPAAFGPTDVAVTGIAHVGAILRQVDYAPTYRIAVFRSYAESFCHWLMESGAEFGIDIRF